jgi:hypothetical protein
MSAGAVGFLVDGEPVERKPRGPRYLDQAASHPDLGELLALLGNAEQLTWIELYKAYEIILHAVSGGKKGMQTLAAKQAVPEDQINAFMGSANCPDVSGADARHARLSGGPPTRSMTLPDGRHFIRDLARRRLIDPPSSP